MRVIDIVAPLTVFVSVFLVAFFFPSIVGYYMVGLLVVAIILQLVYWYLRFKTERLKKKVREIDDDLIHKFDPPIDPLFGKR
jgi:O-antigen/teichoic acid export membrane protein